MKLDKPNGASLTEPLEIGVKNSYEFDTLGAGVYTITVIEVATNKSSVPRAVTLTSTYIAPTFTLSNIKGPNCAGTGNDGSITFIVAAGGEGALAVKLQGLMARCIAKPTTLLQPLLNLPLLYKVLMLNL